MITTLTPVPAAPEDAPAIARILSDWIDATPWMPRVHTREEDQGFGRMLVTRGWTQVVRAGGNAVGFLSRDGAEVHALYVARTARGRGVGKALLDQAKAAAPLLQLYTFQANTAAQRFYLREGFVEISRTDGAGNDEHLPDIRYEWRHA
ncbi:GNAT family N-acetyltransferase [Aliiroseovarius sp.]|uniref:GNAT family N-acetyltransferase n=1 Tax=Aliiroseovarius sp. TaxID=1872442 RepID=UPI00260B037A|nr:GNAT family N-acetyltransferase [Aliiroseovarius sp.]